MPVGFTLGRFPPGGGQPGFLASYGWPERAAVVDCDPHYKYSVMYHLEDLPPLCLLYGKADESSPFSQTLELAKELESPGDVVRVLVL